METVFGIRHVEPSPGTPPGAIAVDASDPNTASIDPDANRRVFTSPLRDATTGVSGDPLVAGFSVVGGTSLDIEVWYYDRQLARWFVVTGASAVTCPADALTVVDNIPPGALLFVRIVTNTGGATQLGVSFM